MHKRKTSRTYRRARNWLDWVWSVSAQMNIEFDVVAWPEMEKHEQGQAVGPST